MHKAILPTIEPTSTDWAQLAAFIDGEGHISIEKGRRPKHWHGVTYCLYVGLCNTDPRLPRWAAAHFGGTVYGHKVHDTNNFVVFYWRLCNKSAERVLRGCLPYFIIKGEQASIALAFRETFRGSKRIPHVRQDGGGMSYLDPAVLDVREDYLQQLLQVRSLHKIRVEEPKSVQ